MCRAEGAAGQERLAEAAAAGEGPQSSAVGLSGNGRDPVGVLIMYHDARCGGVRQEEAGAAEQGPKKSA